MIFKATFNPYRILAPNIVKQIYDGWGWVGVAISKFTVRLWWVGNGSTFWSGAGLWGSFKEHRRLEILKHNLIHCLLYFSVLPLEKRDNIKFGGFIRLGRIELDISIYNIKPSTARPDLWGSSKW